MFGIRIGLVIGAMLALSPALAVAHVTQLDFTDSHGDVADLTLNSSSPASPGGSLVTSITGTLNGIAASEVAVFGADNKIFSPGAFVDYAGLGFTNGLTSLNLYWTNPVRGASPGELGVCYTGSCNQTSGFYSLTSFSVPEPATWAMMLIGVGFVGAGLRMRRKEVIIAA
jgi:hypothetical protein